MEISPQEDDKCSSTKMIEMLFHRHSCLATSQLSSSCHPWDESHRCMGILYKEVVSPCQFCLNPVWLRVSEEGQQKENERNLFSTSVVVTVRLFCLCHAHIPQVSMVKGNLKKTHLALLPLSHCFLLLHIIWLCPCLSLLHCHLSYRLKGSQIPSHYFPWSCQVGK